MFCPVCKGEYRSGFYRCADCNVELVAALPAPPALSNPQGDLRGEEPAVLCQEDDPAILTAIISALNEAHLHYYDCPIQGFEVHGSPSFPAGLSLGRSYEIRVLKSDLQTAQRILQKVLDEVDELPRADPEEYLGKEQIPEEREVPEDWNPERAVAEIWSGEDVSMGQFLS